MAAQEKPQRARVLSGGGGRGAYACGVYKYLEEIGWEPDILVGTSIGAITAAAIASGKRATDLEQAWLSTRTRDIQRFWRWRPWRSIYDTTPWYRTLHRFIDFDGLTRTQKRLLIAASEVEGGDLHVFDNQEVSLTPQHIIASCSIPLVYPWTRVGQKHYWDGAVMSNTPLRAAADAGADEIVVVLLSPVGARQLPLPRRPWEALAVMLDLALSATFESDYKHLMNINRLVEAGLDTKHRRVECRVVAPSEETEITRIIRYEPRASQALIERGYTDARQLLGE